ncbi:Serine/threonine-protein kinase 24 [Quaeritorhiza haematococci]|nr:Serine/threonine-protein kinase 24 [Quaeritorhiza haematococci]
MSTKGPQIVALKVIDLEKTMDDLEDLLAEVDFQAKCDSPHLARYFGSWMWQNKLSIAMEFLGGGTCEELVSFNLKEYSTAQVPRPGSEKLSSNASHSTQLKHTKINEEQCAYIIQEVLKGLNYMHKNLKIHRDIKTANILFDNFGTVKLADFGVAAQLTTNRRFRNTFVGTPVGISITSSGTQEFEHETALD